jgi:serine/threonine-protein kinase PRP4
VRERQEAANRSYGQPISYAEVDNPNPVPDFREGLSIDNLRQKPSNGDRQPKGLRQPHAQQHAPSNGPKTQAAQPSVAEDVEM